MTQDEAMREIWIAHEEDRQINFEYAHLYHIDLSGTNLNGANFCGSSMRYANLSESILAKANMSNANLIDATICRSSLREANLIKSDLTGANLRDTNLACSDLTGANLWRANLWRANLYNVNLTGANLRDVIGNGLEVKTIQTDLWSVTYTYDTMQIGCKKFFINEWWNFDDETIRYMDESALKWWKVWKPILQQIIKISPARQTNFEI